MASGPGIERAVVDVELLERGYACPIGCVERMVEVGRGLDRAVVHMHRRKEHAVGKAC